MTEQMKTKACCLIVLALETQERNDFELVCRRSGFSVDNVDSGFKLLSMLEKTHYDALIIGSEVPDMPLDEILVLVRSSFPAISFPVIMFLDKYNDDIVARYMELEVSDFFRRPINYNRAMGQINQLIKSTSSS